MPGRVMLAPASLLWLSCAILHVDAFSTTISPKFKGSLKGITAASFAQRSSSNLCAVSGLRMSEQDSQDEVVPAAGEEAPIQRKRSWFSRNVPEEKLNARKYFDIENKGEVLAGPDRKEIWGEDLTEIGKWQRTKGPVYVQLSGLGFLVFGFVDYFALGNVAGSASPLFTMGIFTALLGIALQRQP